MKGIDPSCNTIDSGAASGISLVPDASAGSIKPRPVLFFFFFFLVWFCFDFFFLALILKSHHGRAARLKSKGSKEKGKKPGNRGTLSG